MQRLPLAEGTPEGLEVWHLALDLTAPIADDDDRLLSRAEWQRASGFAIAPMPSGPWQHALLCGGCYLRTPV